MSTSTLRVKELTAGSVTPAVSDTLVRLGMAAFKDQPNHIIFPRPVLVDGFNVEEHGWRVGNLERSLKDPARHHVVVVEEKEVDGVETETYAGFAIWAGPPDPDEPVKSDEEKEREKKEAMDSWPPSLSREGMRVIMEEGKRMEEECMGYAQAEGRQRFWSKYFLFCG